MELLPKEKAKSAVWSYFGFKPGPDGKPEDVSTAICRTCKRTVSAKGGNTSNLFSHLKKNHPAIYAEAKAGSCTDRNLSQRSSSRSQQPTITESIATAQKYARSSKRWQQLTDVVTRCLAKDSLPLHTVEKAGFKKMLAAFDERYELPSRKYFSQTAIPALYNKVRKTVECDVQQAEFYSSTTDLWSSQGMLPYMSYTVHYIDSSWQYQSRCLETCFLPEDHTGEIIADALKGVLESWQLKEEKQFCLTTDNGANIISATRQIGWQRLPCFGHCLNLAVTNALKCDSRVARALGVARKIVSAFSTSWKRRRDLTKSQAEKKLPEHSLVADCVTRWGSMERMVSRLLEQEEALRVVLSSDRKTSHLIPTWQDTHVWESITKALSPIAELTDFLSGDTHVTVSSILPVLHNLRSRVLAEDSSDTPLTKEIKKKVLDSLDSRYCDPKVKEILNLATFLDPRFKTDFVEGVELELLEDEVVDRGMELIPSEEQQEPQGAETAAPPPPKKRKLVTFLKKDTAATSSASLSSLQKFKIEIVITHPLHTFNSY